MAGRWWANITSIINIEYDGGDDGDEEEEEEEEDF